MSSDEVKDILQAILEGQQKLSAELQGFRKEMKEETKAICEEMATKEDVAEIREDIHTLIELYGEQQHEVRKLKRKVREAQ